ncbi:histidine kinase N-terminal 7TM domain-containing diguanylate cyclase [Cellulomonas carbonis]|uniref:Diguanylate cyclase n=1 Tax=Cellulomonas carbonis T26 TaxID=947969 RepID=A0A0A0BS20_9CELL|nr:diguanylate cyclase [Cellulomonas carbonis]KGM09954.1 diguanylate cyclase [Cellulomonas carbonis T26]GGC16684.1 hypothetical protein GCM10010972_32500 [Cellulomonas carbonis]
MGSVDATYALAYGSSAVLALALGAYVLLRRERHVLTVTLTVYLVANGLWSSAELAALWLGPVRGRLVSGLILPAVAVVVAACWALVQGVRDVTWRPGRRTLAVLAAHPVLVLVAGVTDAWHHWVLDADGAGYAWLFWVHTAYSYGVVTLCVVMLLVARRSASAPQRRRIATLLLASSLPVVGNVITIATLGPDAHDLTPVFFLAAAVVFSWAVLRQGLLDVVPVARAHVLEMLGDAVLVTDETGRLADVNAAARRLLAQVGVEAVVGRPGAMVLGPVAGALLGASGRHACDVGTSRLVLDVRRTELVDRRGRALGAVVVARDVTGESEREEQLATANAALHAHLETIERLRADVAEQAVRDAMTGLHNRRHLDDVFPVLLDRCDADGVPLSVVLVDVDHFKAVNDDHGHAVGDRMLVAVGRALAIGLEPDEVLVRYGGEEFVVLLPGAARDVARVRAEALRRGCADAVVDVRGGTLAVTASAGVATSCERWATPSALLDAADAALYAAKRGGRDRTVVAGTGHVRLPRPSLPSDAPRASTAR